MGWGHDSDEMDYQELKREMEEVREMVYQQPAQVGGSNANDFSGFGKRSATRSTGSITGIVAWDPKDHRRYDTEAPPNGGSNVFNTIFVGGASIVVTPKDILDIGELNVRTIANPIHDGQIITITPDNGRTMALLAPSGGLGNINITADQTGITDDEVLLLQWQENSAIATSSSGSWIIVSGSSTGSGGTLPAGTADNQHLEWDVPTSQWLAQSFMEFGVIPADAATLRFSNNQFLAWRSSGDFDNATFGVDASNEFAFGRATGTTQVFFDTMDLKGVGSIAPDDSLGTPRPTTGWGRFPSGLELIWKNSGGTDDLIFDTGQDADTQDAWIFDIDGIGQYTMGKFAMDFKGNNLKNVRGIAMIASGNADVGDVIEPFRSMYADKFLPQSATLTTNTPGLKRNSDIIIIDMVNNSGTFEIREDGGLGNGSLTYENNGSNALLTLQNTTQTIQLTTSGTSRASIVYNNVDLAFNADVGISTQGIRFRTSVTSGGAVLDRMFISGTQIEFFEELDMSAGVSVNNIINTGHIFPASNANFDLGGNGLDPPTVQRGYRHVYITGGLKHMLNPDERFVNFDGGGVDIAALGTGDVAGLTGDILTVIQCLNGRISFSSDTNNDYTFSGGGTRAIRSASGVLGFQVTSSNIGLGSVGTNQIPYVSTVLGSDATPSDSRLDGLFGNANGCIGLQYHGANPVGSGRFRLWGQFNGSWESTQLF